MKTFKALPSFEAVSKVSKFSNLRNNYVDENLPINIDCKYYPVDNFRKFQAKNKKNFNIFHSNVNGLESHHDVLHTFLSGIPTDFDVLNITETSVRKEGCFMSMSMSPWKVMIHILLLPTLAEVELAFMSRMPLIVMKEQI